MNTASQPVQPVLRPDVGGVGLCRLLRADGSEWRVTDLRHGEHGLEVDAVRIGVPASGGGSGGGGRRLQRLDGVPLDRGDLLQWIGDEGEVHSSLSLPVRPARA